MSADEQKPSSWALTIAIVVIVIGVFLTWKLFLSQPVDKKEIIEEPVIIEKSVEKTTELNDVTQDQSMAPSLDAPRILIKESLEIVEPIAIESKINIPELNESDSWVREKLSAIIWRKELLGLIIDEDMIRRFVVFVDNFSQGNIAYSYTPLIKPSVPFIATKDKLPSNADDNNTQLWTFDESNFKRFSLYVDLFRSVDSDTLVEYYQEIQPLIKQAYSELGYPDKDFKQALQLAIAKVLDLEFPKGDNKLIRPSVMYRYYDEEIETLDDADKLMLRVGKDNLLIIKSVLLEINEKLYRVN